MSTGASLSAPLLPGQAKAARQRSEQKIQSYLRDIPEGLWQRPAVMTEKDKKKLVVKRLEHLFTGKMGDLAERVSLPSMPSPIIEDVQMEGFDGGVTPAVIPSEAIREAPIRPQTLGRKESCLRDNGSASNSHSHSHSYSNGDQTDPRDNGNGSGSGGGGHTGGGGASGNNLSPHVSMPPPEQRPTRPRDLDPDRKQVPSENMDYIRHLGLVAPESHKQYSARDVSPDAEGWVYLNLLCNLAQLHILNVTPAFIRNAVSEKSTKFQLSLDGRKIRWRGGVEGTRFSSDSGSNSQRQSGDDTDGSNDQEQRKKQKTQTQTQMQTQGFGNTVTACKPSKFGLGVHDSNSSESFHYKPLFVHRQTSSSDEQPSGGDETGSSYGPPEESNLGLNNSRWGQSGVSRVSQRKRRRDGAIIYYSGAPFCTDLSGDFGGGEVSPATHDMTSSGDQGPISLDIHRPQFRPQFSRSTSGSSLPYRPFSILHTRDTLMDLDDSDPPELIVGETEDDIDAEFPWSDRQQQQRRAPLLNLEASGLGGVSPEDHFVVAVLTRRPKSLKTDFNNSSKHDDDNDDDDHDDNIQTMRPRELERLSRDTTDSKAATETIIHKLATMTTESPLPLYMPDVSAHPVQIEYITSRTRHLPPVPLPPPTFYFPASDSDLDDEDDDSGEDASSESLMSRRAILEDDPSSDVDLSGNDEEDEHSDDVHTYDDGNDNISPANAKVSGISNLEPGHDALGLSKVITGSSVATAGGAASGYNSSVEEL